MIKVSQLRELFLGISIFVLAFSALGIGINSMSYSSPDEKRYIQSAKEMIDTGDWITPRYHNRPRFQKPIFFYWLSAASMSLLGKGWAAARLPSVTAGSFVVLITYLIGRCLYGARTGLFSAMLLLTSEIFFLYSRLSTPDMTLLLFIALSIYLFTVIFFEKPSELLWYAFFSALALSTLTKGLAGLLIPLIVVAIFTLIFRKKGLYKTCNKALAAAVFLLILMPWFIIICSIHGRAYIDHIWQVETVNRIRAVWAEGGNAFLKPAENIIHYVVMALFLFMPAALFLPAAAADVLRQKAAGRQNTLIFLWVFTVLIFFSVIGTRKTHYILLLSPAICLIIGKYFDDFSKGKVPVLGFFMPYFCTCVVYLLAAILATYAMKYLLEVAIPVWNYLIVAASAASLFLLVKRKRLMMAQSFIITSIFVFIFFFGFLVPAINDDNGLIAISKQILTRFKDGDVVGVGSHFISHNRLESYLGMNVRKVNVDLGDAKAQVEASRVMLTSFLGRRERVFCLVTRADYENYIPAAFKKNIFIISKAWYWKKPNQLKLDKGALRSVLTKDKASFKKAFKNEIYLISNKPGDDTAALTKTNLCGMITT